MTPSAAATAEALCTVVSVGGEQEAVDAVDVGHGVTGQGRPATSHGVEAPGRALGGERR